MTLNCAVVGAGPSGFYATAMLLAEGFAVDLYDVLPTPFGLVRAGVAPDHPNIKAVTRVFERTARHASFRFFGGVELGADVSRAELLERYHVVVYAIGAATDNRLGIPGEELLGSLPATEFVAWYNGHPHHAHRDFDLSAERAVVIGNGNVAIDVARMLVLHPDELRVTDAADYAIEALGSSNVREVVLLGRRGPAQAAFTNPELRELGELMRADVVVAAEEAALDPLSHGWLEQAGDATSRRNVALLADYAGRPPRGHEHRVVLRFLRSPLALLGDGRVEAVRVSVNRIEAGADGALRAVPTGVTEEIPCGLAIRSIGYRGVPVAGIPFDERRGLIRNDGGRVVDAGGRPQLGEYVVGWIKRGPSGVIGANKKDAAGTVAHLLADRDAGALGAPALPRPGDDWLARRGGRVVGWEGWRAIDAHETARGEPHGRPRVKLVSADELHEAANGVSAPNSLEPSRSC
ncbi:FAD-dependent oxidoreductase [Conexibacter sp. CPCC 206217]|uniref:FAD-dependent oxidoreductase n=1 Tax=Conexibacter sp. CPCC 206217 TaxID=3064574 RepID=UPI00271F9458|nr:FAD-dependent oxidoreductase [Conexibacter sp. CPCC 206217]MDO8208871.1 FAD-dependent oxidoreductase [Conexibacter sp. CPCC 206217]